MMAALVMEMILSRASSLHPTLVPVPLPWTSIPPSVSYRQLTTTLKDLGIVKRFLYVEEELDCGVDTKHVISLLGAFSLGCSLLSLPAPDTFFLSHFLFLHF